MANELLKNRIKGLNKKLKTLSESQLIWIEAIAAQFSRPFRFWKDPSSDFINDQILQDFGDSLRIHHCFSKEAFTKDKFEHALERIFNSSKIKAELASRGNPGHDITINNLKISLKTQANKGIKNDSLHISKFMELGKGKWYDQESDLIGLREQFLLHLQNYDRMFSLRGLETNQPNKWHYELVEIPKNILLMSSNGTFEMLQKSKQLPKPGYCYVRDKKGNLLYSLYFDGGSERKLQIKHLSKLYCKLHAVWEFEI